MKNQKIECLLWDFGDTLVDQKGFLVPPDGVPEWPEVFINNVWNGTWGEDWFEGKIDFPRVCELLSNSLPLRPEDVSAHILTCCNNLKFFENAYSAVKARHYRQALVTINPDLFSSVIVSEYGLDNFFEVIITSWEVQTLDKSILCDFALDQIGISSRDGALLIDNDKGNIDNWISLGGQGYHFRGDKKFAEEVANDLLFEQGLNYFR